MKMWKNNNRPELLGSRLHGRRKLELRREHDSREGGRVMHGAITERPRWRECKWIVGTILAM